MLDSIWDTIRFYGRCFAWAWRGSWDRANAWQTLLGAAIVLAGAEFFGYQVMIPETLFPTIVLAAICVLAAFVFFFLVRLIAAPARLNARTAEKLDAISSRHMLLSEVVRPKLRCSFSMDDLG